MDFPVDPFLLHVCSEWPIPLREVLGMSDFIISNKMSTSTISCICGPIPMCNDKWPIRLRGVFLMFDFITSDKMSTSTISVFVGENRPIVGIPVWEVSRIWVCGTRTARTSEGQDGDGAERDGWASPQ